MSRENFSRKIELLKLSHYCLLPSYVDILRRIANKPFFVKLIDEYIPVIDVLLIILSLFTWKSWINLFAESHIKSKVKLLKKNYIFLLQKAPSKAKQSDIDWLKEKISSLDEFDQSLNSSFHLKSIALVFGPIISGFLISIYQSNDIYSLLLGLNINKTILSFTDVAQFGFFTLLFSTYSPFLGTYSYSYKDTLFNDYKIKDKESKIFSLFSKRIPIEISYNAIIFLVFLAINSFIILRTYFLYGETYLTPEVVSIFASFWSPLLILVFISLKKEKAQKIKSIPFEVLEKGLNLADFCYQIGITKSLFDGYDEKIHEKITINGKVVLRFFKTKVTLEDLVQGQIKVQYNDQSIIVVPDIG